MTTANAPVNLSSDAKDAKLTVVRYLHRLSELEVEGNDAHALQPGGEAGPAAAAARILITQRTGTVERVHHREARPPAVPPVILRPSIPEEGTEHGREGGREGETLAPPLGCSVRGRKCSNISACGHSVSPVQEYK